MLYLVGDRNDALYTLDPSTGVATRVGNAERFGVGYNAPHGLASVRAGAVSWISASGGSGGSTRAASTTARGTVELATGDEAVAGVDVSRAVTPAALKEVTRTIGRSTSSGFGLPSEHAFVTGSLGSSILGQYVDTGYNVPEDVTWIAVNSDNVSYGPAVLPINGLLVKSVGQQVAATPISYNTLDNFYVAISSNRRLLIGNNSSQAVKPVTIWEFSCWWVC